MVRHSEGTIGMSERRNIVAARCSQGPKRGTDGRRCSAIFFHFVNLLLGIGPEMRSRALGMLSYSLRLDIDTMGTK